MFLYYICGCFFSSWYIVYHFTIHFQTISFKQCILRPNFCWSNFDQALRCLLFQRFSYAKIWGPRYIWPPSQLKIDQELPKMMNNIPNIHLLKVHENLTNNKKVTDVHIHILMQIFMSNYNGHCNRLLLKLYSDLLRLNFQFIMEIFFIKTE